jgi:hypothetical protein
MIFEQLIAVGVELPEPDALAPRISEGGFGG